MVSKHKLGITFGAVTAFLHLVWIIAILAGAAKPFMAWALKIHSIKLPYTIIDPTLLGTVYLLVLTFFVGYGLGWLLALIWNVLGRKKRK